MQANKLKLHASKSNNPGNRCENIGHSEDKCRFRDAVCHNCHRKGHLKRMCKSVQNKQGKRRPNKLSNTGKSVHTVEQYSGSEDEIEVDLSYIRQVTTPELEPIYVTPKVNGKSMKMELDTGAAISLLTLEDYKSKFHSQQL